MSDVTDAIALVDAFVGLQEKRLAKASATSQKKSAGTAQGQLDAEVKNRFEPGAASVLDNSPLSNVDEESRTSIVGELGGQLLNSATSRLVQLPNRITESAFSSLSKSDGILGPDSNNMTLSGAGVMGRQSPLIGFTGAGTLSQLGSNTFTVGGREISTSGVEDLAKKTAIDRVFKTINSKVGFDVREVMKDVANAAISITTVLSTTRVDIALELVKHNAVLILHALDRKDAIINKLKTEVRTLHNLVAVVVGGLPNFEDYLRDLITAYNLIISANNDLKSLVRTLKNLSRYNARLFDRALGNLITARRLILPDEKGPPVRIEEFINTILQRSTSSEALAAALAIPGVCQKIATLMIDYSKETLIINELLKTFLTALDEFLNAFKRSSAVDNATIAHIESAIKQLDSLINDMGVVLAPTDGRNLNPGYPVEVTTAAPGWGVRLSTIIEWLQANPSVGSGILDLTSENVVAYNTACGLIKSYGNRTRGFATLKVKEGQEEVADTAKQIGRLLITAATAIVPTKTKQQLAADFRQAFDLLDLSLNLDADLRHALNGFVETQSVFSKNVATLTGNMAKVFEDLGMNRAADLLKKADFKNFFNITPANATYAGAAGAGLGMLLGAISKSSSLTDQDYGKVSEMKSNFDRVADVNLTESVRGYGAQQSIFVAQIQETIKNQAFLSTSVKAIASRVEETSGDDDAVAITKAYAKRAIGSNFTFGAS